MAASSKSELIDVPIEVKVRSGSSLVNVRPLFSYNSKCLIIASGPNIKVYNAQSHECIHILTYHKRNIVSLQENKANCLQFFSCSQDGTVVRWEIVEGTMLQVYDLHNSVTSFYAPTDSATWFITKKIEDGYGIYSLIFEKKKVAPTMHCVMKPVLPYQNAVSFGFKGKFLAGVYENSLKIFKLETKEFVRHLCGTYKLKCVACHPTDFSLATGDDQGRVLIWSNLMNSKSPIRSIYHWHTLPVADLAFSAEGSHLYSGGGEACLVKWNLFSGENFFLPRLGAPIVWVKESPDSSCLVTSLEDNSLQIIDSNRTVVGLIQGLTRGYFHGDPKQSILSTGLLYDPQTKSLVLNGKPGHLQFYSVFDDKHLFNLDISARNFITHERDQESYNVDVSKASFDESGHWLATVEYWSNEEVSPMIWLKFWQYNAVNQKFVMNTNVYLPHDKEVNCIIFRPYNASDTLPLAVTTSNDCRFKTWILYDDDSFEGKQSWNCSSMDYYREELPTGDASFSEDGSVLAIAVNNIATLWTNDNTQLEAALFQEKNENAIKQLRFGRQSCRHLLVCHDGLQIYVWNVLSLSITYTIHVTIQTLAVDSYSDLMAAFCNGDENCQNLYLFKPNSPHPIFFKKNISDKPVLNAVFIPKSSNDIAEISLLEKSNIFYFNEDQCLLTLTDECENDTDINLKKIKMNVNLPMTPFGFLQAEQKSSNIREVKQKPLVIQNQDSTKDSLEYPNPTYVDHLAVCTKVLRNLLRPKPSQETSTEDDSGKIKVKKKIQFNEENLNDQLEFTNLKQEDTESAEDFPIRVTDFSFLTKLVSFDEAMS